DPSQAPQEWPYPRAGKANAEVRLGVLPAAGGDTVWVRWDHERYPYLATVEWPAGAPLTLVVQNRRQIEELVLAVDPDSGETTTLLTETDEAWLNLDQEMPHWLPGGDAFLWTTERGGSWQLELRSRDGSLIHAVNRPDFGYHDFFHFDAASDTVVVAASEDPTESHLWRLPLDPGRGQPERLTREAGVHEATWSRDGKLSVHSVDPLGGAPRHLVRAADGRELGVLKSVTETPPFTPGLEFVTVGDELRFHAVVIRPRDFDPTLRYPVLVRVYGGPGHQTVLKEQTRYLFHQWMAEQGFIVVSIDGRGTSNRGRAWERAVKYNFIDLPLADQSAALQALGRRFSELDLSRVGIFGWSFGGYFSAMATMRRPELFHVGIAGAPVCDWHDYDTHYTERFIGLPREHPEAYEASSVLTYAAELQVPLMIIHGTADDNVYFVHSLKMSDALFRAGRRHDFLPLAGFTHSVPDPLVTTRLYSRIMGYLEEHLGDPRAVAESLP
ncbi:MAG: S9 family peptidase, partial [bacterium]|nr:S9 family peptidase [bacterium]